mgnify:CR=1 FL=1|tara:strand:+ start:4161 stop:4409 length:249 start_codon:yes stop_codon:yes gene_type:complete
MEERISLLEEKVEHLYKMLSEMDKLVAKFNKNTEYVTNILQGSIKFQKQNEKNNEVIENNFKDVLDRISNLKNEVKSIKSKI